MNTHSRMSTHPAPQAGQVKLHETFFALFGGPIAWFLQLCAGFALSSEPCFVDGMRSSEIIFT
jgi:hypothetical protein